MQNSSKAVLFHSAECCAFSTSRNISMFTCQSFDPHFLNARHRRTRSPERSTRSGEEDNHIPAKACPLLHSVCQHFLASDWPRSNITGGYSVALQVPARAFRVNWLVSHYFRHAHLSIFLSTASRHMSSVAMPGSCAAMIAGLRQVRTAPERCPDGAYTLIASLDSNALVLRCSLW